MLFLFVPYQTKHLEMGLEQIISMAKQSMLDLDLHIDRSKIPYYI